MKKKTVIQIDTREKANQHITDWFASRGIKFITSKLYAGDYMNWDNPRLVIERKNSIAELAVCLGKDHQRFRTELANATNCGIHIIILLEEEGYFCLEDVKEWVNPFQKKNPRAISGNTIYKILSRYLEYYDMEIQFCDKAGAGKRILELLKAA